MSRYIRLRIYYTKTDLTSSSVHRTYSFTRASDLNKWNYVCVDVQQWILKDSWFTSRAANKNYQVGELKAHRDGSGTQTALFDDVWIGSNMMAG